MDLLLYDIQDLIVEWMFSRHIGSFLGGRASLTYYRIWYHRIDCRWMFSRHIGSFLAVVHREWTRQPLTADTVPYRTGYKKGACVTYTRTVCGQ